MLGQLRFVIFTFLFILNINKISGIVETSKELPRICVSGTQLLTFKSLEEYQHNKVSFRYGDKGFRGNRISFDIPRMEILNNYTFLSYYDVWVTGLFLDNKEIAVVHDETFYTLRCLGKLILSENHIRSLSTDTFKGLRRLTLLDLRGNYISKLFIDTFHQVKNLNELDLSHNQIEFIELGTFNQLKLLQILRLNHNRLHVLALDIFQGASKLRFIDLNNCVLTNLITVTDWPPITLESLQVLNISHNRLYSYQSNVTYPSLTELHLEFNYLETLSIPRLKDRCKILKNLYLHNNTFKCTEIKRLLSELKHENFSNFGIVKCVNTTFTVSDYPTRLAYTAFVMLIIMFLASCAAFYFMYKGSLTFR